MASRKYAALAALWASTATAFRDTSPFFLFSTADQFNHQTFPQIANSGDISKAIESTLKECPSQTYVVVTQPEVSASDFAQQSSAPHLAQYLDKEAKGHKASIVVPEVIGGIDGDRIAHLLETACGGTLTTVDPNSGHLSVGTAGVKVLRVNFSVPKPDSRSQALSQHDSFLNSIVRTFQDDKYTVIYTTTPPKELPAPETAPKKHQESSLYEMDDPYPSSSRMELKRDLSSRADKPHANDVPIFEKYQFFTPGIFMGFIAATPLFLILYYGLRCIAGIEVSYYAFSKEMGPAAQKKQG